MNSKGLDELYEKILPSIKIFINDYLLPSVNAPDNNDAKVFSTLLGNWMEEKLEKTIIEEMLGQNRISSEELTGEKSNSNQELINEKIIEEPANSNQEITSNSKESEITYEDEREKPYNKRITRNQKQKEEDYEDSEYETPTTSKVASNLKRSNKNNTNSKNKKTKIDQKNDIISIAESLLKEISLVFQPKIQNKAIQTKENSSIMLAIDTRNTETLTGYVPNPNDVDINHIVDQEIRIHLEVSELEEKYHNAAFNYYFKLYEWSRLKDQQILWLYNHPEPAKKLFNIDIDSKCSIEESSKKVKKYFLI
jgi:hypothetical protein